MRVIARRKKSAKKSESAERERKKREFALLPPHSGNPVSEPKADGRGKARVLIGYGRVPPPPL